MIKLKDLLEQVSKSELDAVESYADKIFMKLGVDVEFTKHFLDRLNDARNGKPISVAELMGLFKRLHKKHGKPLATKEDGFEAVVKEFNSNINVPFVINIKNNEIELIAKTIMRKKDFKTTSPTISL
jgi:hypothetical protein